MVCTPYSYPATLEPDEDGRLVVHFLSFPEALTDGADETEALHEAADCLSEALASRIVDGEEIPGPTPMGPGQHLIAPDPTIALKAALYMALRRRDMTVADLADRLEVDWHQAARLIDPKRASKLTSLAMALAALGCQIRISIEDQAPQGARISPSVAEMLAIPPLRDDGFFRALEKARILFRGIAEELVQSAPDNPRVEAARRIQLALEEMERAR
jgi:antitoxin HicB